MIKKAGKICVIAIMLISLLSMFGCAALSVDISQYQYEPKGKTSIYSSDNVLIAEVYSENRTYVRIDEVPEHFLKAVVAIEDRTFYTHRGISIKGIFRAIVQNIASKNMYGQGASTITQQVVKKLFLSDEKSYLRKLNDMVLAMRMERVFSKEQILEIYINQMYLGAGAYGVQEASRIYFGKNAIDMNVAEAAMIAGLFQAPSAYNPFDNFESAKARQERVLDAMVQMEYITPEQAAEYKAIPIVLATKKEDFRGVINKDCSAFVRSAIDEYFVRMVPILQEKYGIDAESAKALAEKYLREDGVVIRTTLNYKAQMTAVRTIENTLSRYGLVRKQATGALVSVDYNTGAIRAYYGGNTEIDMANSPRQPGSAIKPFYYAKAIDANIITPYTIVYDVPTSWGKYTPKNYEGGFQGAMTVREALIRSRNIPAITIFEKYGVERSMTALKEFGFTTILDSDYNLATALGGLTYGLKPVEMAKAYAAFANGGTVNELYRIESIVDHDGNELFNIANITLERRQVLSTKTAGIMNEMLRAVVSRGTGTAAGVRGYSTGGKTGTTSDKKDLWFVGFSGNLSIAIWLGNLDMEVIGGSSTYSASAFGSYMRGIIQNGALQEMGGTR
jgi:penicillin-binding protein 1A